MSVEPRAGITEPRSSPAPEPHNAPMKRSASGESITLDRSIRWQANETDSPPMTSADAQPRSEERFQEALFESLFTEERAERTVSAHQIESNGGPTVGELAGLWRAFGLPAPAPERPYFTPDEAAALTSLSQLGDLWPPEVRLKVARIYGHGLSQMATTEVEVFRSHVERNIREASPHEEAAITEVARAYGRLAPLVAPVMLGVHQRWLEHVMAQAAVGLTTTEEMERFVDTVDVTLLFCDLIDFTHYTASHGDLAAAHIAAELADIVHQHGGADGYLVKELGDGALIAYSDPSAAVAAWVEITEAARARSLPPLHGGIHRGEAVFREGDYFGTAVNLTARLAAMAHRGELWATESVVAATDNELTWQPRGRRRLAGIPELVALFSLDGELSSARTEARAHMRQAG
jgi:adenylate cyclase